MANIFVKISEKLWLELNDMRIDFRMNWDQFIDYLCSTVKMPEKIQNDYVLHFGAEDMKLMNVKVSVATEKKFKKFAKRFKSFWHTLDYLAEFGQSRGIFDKLS